MKKSKLKTGMTIKTNKGHFSKVMLGTENGDILAGDGTSSDVNRTWCSLSDYNEAMEYIEHKTSEMIVAVYQMESNMNGASIERRGKLLWEREQEKTVNIDGVDYSESTLRSIIKKATG